MTGGEKGRTSIWLVVDEHDCALDPVTFVEALARVLSHRTPDQLHSSLTVAGKAQIGLHHLECMADRVHRNIGALGFVQQCGHLPRDGDDGTMLSCLHPTARIEVQDACRRIPLATLGIDRDVMCRIRPGPYGNAYL